MGADGLEIVDGTIAGAWIEPELSDEVGSVAGSVPDRFPAYVRILHPAQGTGGNPVSWGKVAGERGTKMHPLVQWDALVGANRYLDEEPDWPGGQPDRGALDPDLLEALCEILAQHASTTERCFFGVWEGGHTKGELAEALPAISSVELSRPLLPLPPDAGRDYVVISGPLQSASPLFQLTWLNMIWPADRAWFVATDIDFDSTLVGGSESLAEEILSRPEFEAFPIGPSDSLAWDADRINPPLQGMEGA